MKAAHIGLCFPTKGKTFCGGPIFFICSGAVNAPGIEVLPSAKHSCRAKRRVYSSAMISHLRFTCLFQNHAPVALPKAARIGLVVVDMHHRGKLGGYPHLHVLEHQRAAGKALEAHPLPVRHAEAGGVSGVM